MEVDKKIALLISVFVFSVWLLYWTGRFYKEWYFSKFGINYETVNFDKLYYVFGSWATVLVAISCITIVCNICLAFYIGTDWYWRIMSIVILLSTVFIIFFWPIKFDPTTSLFRKVLGSRDICVAILGIISILTIAVFAFQQQSYFSSFFINTIEFIKNHIYVTFSVALLAIWLYLTVMAYVMGNYHGSSAIWEGKMGLRWCKINNSQKWWIIVLRTNDGRNFLYDREEDINKIIPDAEIEKINGFVTKFPKE